MANEQDFKKLLETQKETNKQLALLRQEQMQIAKDPPEKFTEGEEFKATALHIASEKLIDLVDEIENLRQDCLSEKKVLIQGPNTLAAFLDTIRIGHHYLQLNETAAKVAEVVRRIKSQFDSFDKSTDGVLKRLDASVKEVTALQTRINVLGRELNKGTEELKDE